jgi:hypothetical protein
MKRYSSNESYFPIKSTGVMGDIFTFTHLKYGYDSFGRVMGHFHRVSTFCMPDKTEYEDVKNVPHNRSRGILRGNSVNPGILILDPGLCAGTLSSNELGEKPKSI